MERTCRVTCTLRTGLSRKNSKSFYSQLTEGNWSHLSDLLELADTIWFDAHSEAHTIEICLGYSTYDRRWSGDSSQPKNVEYYNIVSETKKID